MSRHTKGPWHVGEMRAGQIAIKRGDGSHFVLADVDAMYTADVAEAEANARLIAAAPELLVALKAAAQFLDPKVSRGHTVNGWDNTCQLVDAAIAKAEGEVQS